LEAGRPYDILVPLGQLLVAGKSKERMHRLRDEKKAGNQPPSKISWALRAFRYRNYRLFFSGQLISLIGTWMQQVAQAWLVYSMTHSSFMLGAVTFAGQIPVFLFTLLGGTVADRWSRHRIVVASQVVSMTLAFILSALALSGWVEVWHVVLLAVGLGIVSAFEIPARQAFIVEMVDEKDMINAIGLNSSMFNSARIIGPAVAGLMVAAIGEGWCFFWNGVSYLAVIAGLLMMRLPPFIPPEQKRSHLEDILEGFRFARQAAPIRKLLLLLGLTSLMGSPYMVLMPIFAGSILNSGAWGLGMLMGCSGIGALLGALMLAMHEGLRGLSRWIALAGGTMGIGLMLFSYSRIFGLSLLLSALVGYGMMASMACTNTLLQSMTPDHMRGRVLSIYTMMFLGMAPFGSLLAGGAAERFGAPITVATGGLLCLAGAIAFGRNVPTFRKEARAMVQARQQEQQASSSS
jgi:MFS family permease